MRKAFSLVAATGVVVAGLAIGVLEHQSGPTTTGKTDRLATKSFATERFAG